MSDIPLIQRIEQYAREKEFTLPVFNKVAVKLLQLIEKEDYRIGEIEQLIHYDQVLMAEVLRAANSPYFAGLAKITTVKDAVVRLGEKQLVQLILLVSERNKYQVHSPKLRAFTKKMWQAAVAKAMGSQWLSDRLDYRSVSHEVFIGALLHDIGQLYLLRVLDEILKEKAEDFALHPGMVLELLESFHCQKGYDLLKGWNLPEKFCLMAKCHHDEPLGEADGPTLIIRLVDKACLKLGIGLQLEPSLVLASCEEASLLALREVTLAELEIKMEDSVSFLAV